MKPDPLEQALAAYGRQPLPGCPDRLTSEVWREIDRRRQPAWARLFPGAEWRLLFANPRLALPAVVLALVVGLLPGLLLPKPAADQRLASETFHFEVFSSQAPLAVVARLNPGFGRVQP
jgi:hypothetical protein